MTALYVPPTEESDHKKQNQSLQLIGGQTSTNTTNIATNTAAIAALAGATYVNSFNARTGAVVPVQGDYPTSLIPGTTTNDSATAGNIGEYISTATTALAASATVTMTIASPCVVTWTAHGFAVGTVTTAVRFSTTGALPTGITAATTYYLKAINANTFNIATTADNALAGTFINTSGSQSGVQTADDRASLATGVSQNFAAVSLTAGDWNVTGYGFFATADNATTVQNYNISISATSATSTRIMGRFASQQFSVAGTALGVAEYNVFPIPVFRISIAATTTIYLVGNSTFGVNALNAGGWISARRVR